MKCPVEPVQRARLHLVATLMIRATAVFLSGAAITLAELPARSRIGGVQVRCPSCEHAFEALVVAQANTAEGVDRDLFARAVGPQPVFYRVSTCPNCLYSGYADDFGAGVQVPADFADWAAEHLSAEAGALLPDSGDGVDAPSDVSQDEIPAETRYALALHCYRRLQRLDEALAWLCLRASWVVREENAHLPPDERVARMLSHVRQWLPAESPAQNQADREMVLCTRLAAAIGEGQFNAYQTPYAELVLAFLLRRHGENSPAGRILERLLNEDSFAEPVTGAAERMLSSIERERDWQRQAADYFERALHVRVVGEANEPVALYLLGELYRRLGDPGRAGEYYDRALAEKHLPADLRAWAREQKTAALVQQ